MLRMVSTSRRIRRVRLSASHGGAIPRAGAACRPYNDEAADVCCDRHAADDFPANISSRNDATPTESGPAGDAGRKSAVPDDPEPGDGD